LGEWSQSEIARFCGDDVEYGGGEGVDSGSAVCFRLVKKRKKQRISLYSNSTPCLKYFYALIINFHNANSVNVGRGKGEDWIPDEGIRE
jgi:hypothetical protein